MMLTILICNACGRSSRKRLRDDAGYAYCESCKCVTYHYGETMPTHWACNYSGGAASWVAAKITQERLAAPDDAITLLMADTLIEDEDTYRFAREGAEVLGLPITRIADGRTPFEVFRDERFLGNSRIDPCSKILKRRLLDEWHKQASGNVVVIIGLDWTEVDRFERFQARSDMPVRAPLIEFGIDKKQVHQIVADAGIRRQRLYEMGMQHANCGGGCIKMGHTGWANLYRNMPEVFARWEQEENDLRAYLDRGDIAILKDRSGGGNRPLPLSELRERIEQQPTLIPPHDWGGCGCAVE